MLQLGTAPELRDSAMRQRALVQGFIFNIITGLLIVCYVRSILEHPGEVPDDPAWQQPMDGRQQDPGAMAGLNLQEVRQIQTRPLSPLPRVQDMRFENGSSLSLDL